MNNAKKCAKKTGRAAVVIAGIDSAVAIGGFPLSLFDGFRLRVGVWEIVFSEMRAYRSPKL